VVWGGVGGGGVARPPEPFDETWHVQKKLGDRRASWLIAGIQQND
jgi:predicted lipid-binding transport protein (Tim44 family)